MKAFEKSRNKNRIFKFIIYEFVFITPIMLGFILVKLFPFILTCYYSLTDWNGIRESIKFIGLENFIDLLNDENYWNSFWFTIKFSVVSLVLINVLGFVLAYFLIKPLKCKDFFRAGFYIPNTIGGLVLGFIWRFIFTGLFKKLYVTTGIGFFGLRWLSTPNTAFWGLVIVQVWAQMGYAMLIYISGLIQLPIDVMEAASIDGASRFKTLIYVQFPLLTPTITRAFFITFLTCMRVYDLNLALTAGNPYRSSESITMNIFNTAFSSNEMAYGCAKAVIFVLVVVAVSSFQSYLTSKREVAL